MKTNEIIGLVFGIVCMLLLFYPAIKNFFNDTESGEY